MYAPPAALGGQTAAESDRLLPLLWALDNFKASQAKDIEEGDWTLGKVDEARLPGPGRARAEFVRAMEAWDADAADASIAALCRTSGAAETMEPLWRLGVRDQRNIGDFTRWKDYDAYRRNFERLMRDLSVRRRL